MKAMIGFSLPYSREYLGFAFQVNRFITIRKLLEIRIVLLKILGFSGSILIT